jgi:hypothetical protein
VDLAALVGNAGTLEEFATACDAAYCQLFITWDERNAAVEKYRKELESVQDLPALPGSTTTL